MPLHHARQPYVSPNRLVETLGSLGVGGIVFPGQKAWDCWPRSASPVTVTPNAANNTDGSSATLIIAGQIDTPYYVVGFTFKSRGSGDFQVRFKLDSSAGVTQRRIRAYNDRTTGPNGGIQMPGFPPIFFTQNTGLDVAVATSPGSGPGFDAYAISLRSDMVHIVPDLLVAAPTSHGGAFPDGELGALAETPGTTAWTYGNYYEVTEGLDTPALITAIWATIEQSTADIQVAFATGASGGEVDWGVFGWAVPGGTDDADGRMSLMPFPFYLPAETRLAVRVRSANTTSFGVLVGLEYVPVPLR